MSALWNGLQVFLAETISFFYDIVPNLGIAIILLTILINLLLFPLTLKQTRATRAFQEIQPEIKRLQKRYKDDPQTMQQELVKLQRERGATPGGCLIPLVVQAPIWFALFRVLRVDGETGRIVLQDLVHESSRLAQDLATQGAHFLGMDLARTPAEALSQSGVIGALPYLLLLAFMVGTQYVQQWHAQPPADPHNPQARQMQMVTKIMPLFIGFISYNFPAGLIVYWATSNLFRLAQQVVIFRIDGRPQPMKERPEDDDGAGSGSGDGAGAGPSGSSDAGGAGNGSKPHPSSKKKRNRRKRRR